MKRLVGLLTATCALLLSGGTQAASRATPSVPFAQAEWTVLIYMNADNNLEPDALTNFRQLAAVGSSDAVNVIVQFDRIAKYAHTSPDWAQTLRFRVAKGTKPLPAEAIEDIGEANMGDGRTVADFVAWGKARYPAKHTLLVVWDHGQGWRVLLQELLRRRREMMRRSTATVVRDNLAFLRKQSADLRAGAAPAGATPQRTSFRSAPEASYRSASNDETDRDVLYNREAADALKGVSARVDVLGFDACLMAMAETAYEFQDVADVLVGSEELEPALGWKYDDWLSTLVANPTMDPKALSKALVDSYARTYTNVIPTGGTTLSAIDLRQMKTVAGEITGLSQLLMNDLDAQLQPLLESRQAIATYAPGYEFYHVDLTQFLLELGQRTTAPAVRDAAQRVVNAIHGAVLSRYAGSDREGAYGSYGMAIYFPASEYDHVHDPYAEGGYEKDNTLYPVAFVQEQKWADFLHAFWSRVP